MIYFIVNTILYFILAGVLDTKGIKYTTWQYYAVYGLVFIITINAIASKH